MRNLNQNNLESREETSSVLAVSAVLAACAVGPDYKQPQVAAPDQFVSGRRARSSRLPTSKATSGKSFSDEQLNGLIEAGADGESRHSHRDGPLARSSRIAR